MRPSSFLKHGVSALVTGALLLLVASHAVAAAGPRIIDPKIAPTAMVEGDIKTRFTIRATVTAPLGSVKKVTVSLAAFGMPDLELFDDGKHDDGAADDKMYANSFVPLKAAAVGPLTLTVTAEGSNGGVTTSTVSLMVSAASASLIVWDGEKITRGQSWVAPQKPVNSFRSQTDEKHSGLAALELHGEGSASIGGGWNWFGWYPDDAGTDTTNFQNFTFWMKVEGDTKPESLILELNSSSKKTTKSVNIASYCDDLMDGEWHDVVIPLRDIYKDADPDFDPKKVWMANFNTWSPTERNFSIYIDDIGFDNRSVRSRLEWVTLPEARTPDPLGKDTPVVTAQVDIKATGTKISPYIYGAAMGDQKAAQEMGLTILRAGGNEVSPLNWKEGFTSHGSDWFYTNTGEETPPEKNWLLTFHGKNKAAGIETYLSMPAMGRVAKDSSSSAFDINKYPDQDSWVGQQQPTDPHPNAGSGRAFVKGPDGKDVLDKNGKSVVKEIEPDPNDTSIEMTPEDQTGMLKFMIETLGYGTADNGGVKFIAIDNEPDLWAATHRDMHPKGASYDEYLDRTKTYAALLKKIDPTVKIAGPVFSGWTGYFFSGLDLQEINAGRGTWANPPDYAAHGNVPVLKWWLQQMYEYEKKIGQRLVDILDVHFYPQNGLYMGGRKNDPATMEKRVQETRVLWDPTWKDPSWMAGDENGKKLDGHLQIIRMMKKLIADYDPGLDLCFGEYCFSGEGDVSGGVTQSEVLGIFAREGVAQAYYWFFPLVNSSAYFAFKMFRNPDGRHTAFGDTYLPSTVSAPDDISVHAARDSATGRLTFVLVNKRVAKAAKVTIKLSAPVKSQDVTFYQYSGFDRLCIGQLPVQKVVGSAVAVDMPALSVLRFDLAP
ncbi:MAG: glycoside hydrolase family 44 protein [Chthoniobacteraceae bacterium]